MSTYKDAHHRSILKALSWRVLASISTMLIVFAFTRKIALSAGVGAVEVIVKLALYYVHERIWGCIGIGQNKHPLSGLPVNKQLQAEDMEEVKKKLKDLGYISDD